MIYPAGLKIYSHSNVFKTEKGKSLPDLQIGYHSFGKLNAAKDNVVWVFHALTANSDPTVWWKGIIGEGSLIDPEEYFIVCANVLGSCYGSTNPRSVNPATGREYGIGFPEFTVRDVSRVHHMLRIHLGIERIQICIGGSFGGHQAQEFTLLEPKRVDSLFLLATSAKETAWSIAIHEAQRMAIETDLSWKENRKDAGAQGLKTARALGLISYRTFQKYKEEQSNQDERTEDFKAASYVRYQGEKLAVRFHAHCYWHLSKCLDTHHIGRNRGNIQSVLNSIHIPVTIIGIESDLLIPVSEQKFLAKHLPDAIYHEIRSEYGHDGFLTEVKQINAILEKHLQKLFSCV
jgi:homoserine O-acetyltransferase/O-succinyltransferase